MWSNVLSPGVEDPRTYHQGLPPKTGLKFGVNCFFNDKPLKQWEDVDSDVGDDASELAMAKPSASRWRTIDGQQLLAENRTVLQPGQIPAFSVNQEPKIIVIPGFLSPDEAAALISCLGPAEGRVANADELLPRLEQKIASAAGLPLKHMDPLRVAKCEPNMTPDGRVLTRGGYSERFGKKVVYIFLNEICKGGEIRFSKLGLQVRPRVGCAVVWQVVGDDGLEDVRSAHQGRPPREGIRYSAMGVFREQPVRQPLPPT